MLITTQSRRFCPEERTANDSVDVENSARGGILHAPGGMHEIHPRQAFV
jgi:hypothetical protein